MGLYFKFCIQFDDASRENIRKWSDSWISSSGDQPCWSGGIMGWACEQQRSFSYFSHYLMTIAAVEGFSGIFFFCYFHASYMFRCTSTVFLRSVVLDTERDNNWNKIKENMRTYNSWHKPWFKMHHDFNWLNFKNGHFNICKGLWFFFP